LSARKKEKKRNDAKPVEMSAGNNRGLRPMQKTNASSTNGTIDEGEDGINVPITQRGESRGPEKKPDTGRQRWEIRFWGEARPRQCQLHSSSQKRRKRRVSQRLHTRLD